MKNNKTITPNPPADFTPTMGNYVQLSPFRYWCQKVLPLVYDDSLSYYELLCKVVDYLNKTMEDVETLHGDVTNLHTAYEELQAYVNDYFSTLDVQKEINKKLDEFAEDGTLTNLLVETGLVQQEITNWLNENVNPAGSAVVIDKSLTIDGAAADAKITGDKLNNINIKVDDISVPITEQIEFDITNHSYIDGTTKNVTITESTTYATVTIDLTDDMVGLYSSQCLAGFSNYYYAFYDNNNSFVSGLKAPDSPTRLKDYIINIPETAKKFSISFASNKLVNLQKITGYECNISVNSHQLSDQIKNIFKPNEYTQKEIRFPNNGYLESTGAVIPFNNCSVSDFIDCSKVCGIKYSGSSYYNGKCIVIYDVDYNVIQYLPEGSNTQKLNIEVYLPNNAKYVRFGDYSKVTSTETEISFSENLSINTEIPDYAKWKNLKWVCVGDSLTEYNSRTSKHYFDYVAEKTGISIINMGLSSSGYMATQDDGTAFYQRVENIPEDADVITIFGSGNDLNLFSKLGTPNDTTTDTICGCINKTLDNIIAKKPDAVIGVVTPTPWIGQQPTLDDNNSMSIYSNSIINICKIRSIPVLDLYRCSGLRPWTEEGRNIAYSKDNGNGVHPDETGHKIIAPRFEGFLDFLLLS